MEEDSLGMGMFEGDGMKLNFNTDPIIEDPTIETEPVQPTVPQTNNNAIEGEGSEEVDGEEDDTTEGGEGSVPSSNLFSSLAAIIHEDGLLPSIDIEKVNISSRDDFAGIIKSEIQTQAQALLEDYISNIDVSKIASSKKVINELADITEDSLKENLDLAKKVIYDDYINQGFDEKKATRMLKRIVDLGEEAVLEDATESLASLREFEARKIEREKQSYAQRLEQEKQEQAKMEAQLKETIYGKKDLIKGYTPTKALQDQVMKSITEIVGKSPDGTFENKFMKQRRENPLEFEIAMYYFYELTNGFKDYTKLAAPAKSSAVKELEQIVRKAKQNDNGTPLWAQSSETYDGPGLALNL